jgi:hypothetical protein
MAAVGEAIKGGSGEPLAVTVRHTRAPASTNRVDMRAGQKPSARLSVGAHNRPVIGA